MRLPPAWPLLRRPLCGHRCAWAAVLCRADGAADAGLPVLQLRDACDTGIRGSGAAIRLRADGDSSGGDARATLSCDGGGAAGGQLQATIARQLISASQRVA